MSEIRKIHSFDTFIRVSIKPLESITGFKEIFCEEHKLSSRPLPNLTVSVTARESSTRWCLECRKLSRCFRAKCRNLDLEDLWLCSSCGVHKCEHLCYVKSQYTATCNGCRYEIMSEPFIEEVTMTEENEILTEIKKLQPVLAPDREREWPWIVKRLNLAPQSTVLDAACGGGFLQKYLLDLGFDVTATDFNLDARFYAEGGPAREKFVLYDLRDGPLREWVDSFDYVLLISTVEHLENEDDTLVVKNLSQCFKRSMFISFPYGIETEWKKIGNNTERFYSESGIYERLLMPAKLKVKDREVFTKEELNWPWKDIMIMEVVK